jgi:hypothetical protein
MVAVGIVEVAAGGADIVPSSVTIGCGVPVSAGGEHEVGHDRSLASPGAACAGAGTGEHGDGHQGG